MVWFDIELIGYLGGGIVAVSLLPQVIKSWQTKSTKDISVVWNSIYLSGLLVWIIYGFGISSMPLVVMCFVEAALATSLLFLKFRYG
jgi:MtN3 and saliva related transmembrane protein